MRSIPEVEQITTPPIKKLKKKVNKGDKAMSYVEQAQKSI
jgi:hypothetical protein